MKSATTRTTTTIYANGNGWITAFHHMSGLSCSSDTLIDVSKYFVIGVTKLVVSPQDPLPCVKNISAIDTTITITTTIPNNNNNNSYNNNSYYYITTTTTNTTIAITITTAYNFYYYYYHHHYCYWWWWWCYCFLCNDK